MRRGCWGPAGGRGSCTVLGTRNVDCAKSSASSADYAPIGALSLILDTKYTRKVRHHPGPAGRLHVLDSTLCRISCEFILLPLEWLHISPGRFRWPPWVPAPSGVLGNGAADAGAKPFPQDTDWIFRYGHFSSMKSADDDRGRLLCALFQLPVGAPPASGWNVCLAS